MFVCQLQVKPKKNHKNIKNRKLSKDVGFNTDKISLPELFVLVIAWF